MPSGPPLPVTALPVLPTGSERTPGIPQRLSLLGLNGLLFLLLLM